MHRGESHLGLTSVGEFTVDQSGINISQAQRPSGQGKTGQTFCWSVQFKGKPSPKRKEKRAPLGNWATQAPHAPHAPHVPHAVSACWPAREDHVAAVRRGVVDHHLRLFSAVAASPLPQGGGGWGPWGGEFPIPVIYFTTEMEPEMEFQGSLPSPNSIFEF